MKRYITIDDEESKKWVNPEDKVNSDSNLSELMTEVENRIQRIAKRRGVHPIDALYGALGFEEFLLDEEAQGSRLLLERKNCKPIELPLEYSLDEDVGEEPPKTVDITARIKRRKQENKGFSR